MSSECALIRFKFVVSVDVGTSAFALKSPVMTIHLYRGMNVDRALKSSSNSDAVGLL